MIDVSDQTTQSAQELPISLHGTSKMNFWKLWSANGFSNLGDGLYQIMLPLLATRLTHSPALVSGVSIMLSLPWLIFALQAGSIVDRHDRRKVILWVSVGRIIILSSLTVAIITQSASIPLLYAAALVLGVGETLADTALASIVPSIVAKERLNWANARIMAAQTVTNTFIGPPLAGYLVGISFALASGSSAFLYLAAGGVLLLVRGVFSPAASERAQADQHFWQHMTEGMRFLWKSPLIRGLTLFTASMNLFWAGWGAVFVLFAVKPGPMGLGEFEYGLVLTAMATGGLLGSTLCERIHKKVGTRNALTLDFVGTVLLVGVPALTTNPFAIGAAAFMAGAGASIWVILVSSIRQQLVPGDLLGRVYSASRFVSWGIGPIGAALAGLVAEIWGIRALFAAGGIISVGLTFLFLNLMSSQMLEAFNKASE